MQLKKLRNRKIKPETILNSFFVFDVETTKLEPMQKNFVFGVIYGNSGHRVIKTISAFKKEFAKKKYENKIIFAHNAEFDLLTIFGNLYENVDSKAIFNGKFITCKYGKVTFADSLNILLVSLEKIGKKLNLKKFTNTKISNEGLSNFNITKKDIDYCVRDCEITFKALAKIFIPLGAVKLTLASASLYEFRKSYLKKNIFYNEFVYDFYESYYGGRTEAFKMGKTDSQVYDVNSLYPYVMEKIILPDVGKLKKETKVDIKYFLWVIKRYEGMAKVDVFHKESYFGFLPYRFDNKLLFPIGNFTTTINFNELRFAMDCDIVEIKKVHYIVYSNGVKSPFADFVVDNFKKRFKTKNEFDKYYYKIKINSLYGRFGMRKKYIDEYFSQIPYEIISELQKTEKYYGLKVFSKDRIDCYLTTVNEQMENSFYAIPTFSSYITSGARVILLRSLLENQKNGVVYCDTDSIFLTGGFVGNVSDSLGDWKLEDKQVKKINGLKNYEFVDLESGEYHHLVKGVSKNAEKISDTQFRIAKYYKTKQALRMGKEAGESYVMEKNLTHKYNKRIILDDGKNTKPIKICTF